MKPARTFGLALGILAALALSLGFTFSGNASEEGGRHTPFHNRYRVELAGQPLDGFQEVSGLGMETAVIEETADGKEGAPVRKLPGRTTYGNITLERAFDPQDRTFSDWAEALAAGHTERKSGSIIYLDREGNEAARWNFYEGWPCKWSLVEVEQNGQWITIERIEIAVERIERK